MANKNAVPPPRRWQKGQSGNPSGKPKNVFTAEELRKKIAKVLALTKEELAKVLQDKDSKALELVLASVVARAIKDGDIGKMEYLFMRTLGKVKDTMEITRPEPVIIQRLDGAEVRLETKLKKEGE
jgi:hypothetical protein